MFNYDHFMVLKIKTKVLLILESLLEGDHKSNITKVILAMLPIDIIK